MFYELKDENKILIECTKMNFIKLKLKELVSDFILEYVPSSRIKFRGEDDSFCDRGRSLILENLVRVMYEFDHLYDIDKMYSYFDNINNERSHYYFLNLILDCANLGEYWTLQYFFETTVEDKILSIIRENIKYRDLIKNNEKVESIEDKKNKYKQECEAMRERDEDAKLVLEELYELGAFSGDE